MWEIDLNLSFWLNVCSRSHRVSGVSIISTSNRNILNAFFKIDSINTGCPTPWWHSRPTSESLRHRENQGGPWTARMKSFTRSTLFIAPTRPSKSVFDLTGSETVRSASVRGWIDDQSCSPSTRRDSRPKHSTMILLQHSVLMLWHIARWRVTSMTRNAPIPKSPHLPIEFHISLANLTKPSCSPLENSHFRQLGSSHVPPISHAW
jgi:hypothetical protein